MKLELDADIQELAEHMQRTIPADRLVQVAAAIAALAPALWGESAPLRFLSPPITA